MVLLLYACLMAKTVKCQGKLNYIILKTAFKIRPAFFSLPQMNVL